MGRWIPRGAQPTATDGRTSACLVFLVFLTSIVSSIGLITLVWVGISSSARVGTRLFLLYLKVVLLLYLKVVLFRSYCLFLILLYHEYFNSMLELGLATFSKLFYSKVCLMCCTLFYVMMFGFNLISYFPSKLLKHTFLLRLVGHPSKQGELTISSSSKETRL